MEYTWNTRNTHGWNTHGIHVEYTQNTHGIHMEYTWNTHGIHMEYSRALPFPPLEQTHTAPLQRVQVPDILSQSSSLALVRRDTSCPLHATLSPRSSGFVHGLRPPHALLHGAPLSSPLSAWCSPLFPSIRCYFRPYGTSTPPFPLPCALLYPSGLVVGNSSAVWELTLPHGRAHLQRVDSQHVRTSSFPCWSSSRCCP